MGKVLRFYSEPNLSQLEGLSINGSSFEKGEGYVVDDGIVMNIPDAFRFETKLEIDKAPDGKHNLFMTQFLTRGVELWEMEGAFGRIGFRNPEIEEQMRSLCDKLVEKALAYWEEVEE